MGFEYREPSPDAEAQKQQYSAAKAAPGAAKASKIPPYTNVHQPADEITQRRQPAAFPDAPQYEEPSYREHVSGNLRWDPAEAPRFRPAYPPYPAYPQYYQPPAPGYAAPMPVYNKPAVPLPPAYPAYPQQPPSNHRAQPYYYPYTAGYPGPYDYPPYVYNWKPATPPRDGYLLGIAITSFICSLLVLLGGLLCALILLLLLISPNSGIVPEKALFSGIVMFTALSVACLVGGSSSLYHSMRSLFFKKPSAAFKLPTFWLFLGLYVLVAATGAALSARNASISNVPFTIFLVALSGVFPALTILALGVRRAGNPKKQRWPTTWRRFTLAIVSGATSAILLASIFELILSFLVGRGLGISGFSIDNPDQSMLQNPRVITFLILLLSVIAPLVEEAVKPLAAIILIGRVRSAAEAFVLGLACGIGFDLIETSGYISQGYQDWLKVALERSPAGLLHGFGAAMVTLGWYYLTHPQASRHRFLLGFGCMLYAVLQHAIWNGTFVLALLPAPLGPFFDHGVVPLGPLSFGGDILPYLVLSLLMVIFFIYVSGKLRLAPGSARPPQPQPQPQLHNKPVPTHV